MSSESSAAQGQDDPLAGLPDDLARVLRDPSIIVPQDAAVFELVAKWMDAPSDTASALTVAEWSKAWSVTCRRMLDAQHENERLEAALRSMRELASVAHNGDPWYAEQEGLDAGAIFEQAREALREEAS